MNPQQETANLPADTNPTLSYNPVARSEYRELLDAHAAVGPPTPNPKPVTTYEHIPYNARTESILERLRGPVPLTEVELPASDRPRPYWIPNQAAIWEERNAAAQRIETLERELVSARKQEASPELLGELTPAMKQRLDSPERDPIEYWERVSDKTLLSGDIIKSMAEHTTQAQRDAARATASPAPTSDAQSSGIGEVMRAVMSSGL